MKTEELYENYEDCINCWGCFNACPFDAITMKAINGKMFPFIDSNNCIDCNKCLEICTVKKEKAELINDNSKKHIGIINLSVTHNYGAVIAAAALEQVVRDIVGKNYIVETINYAPQKEYNNRIEKLHDDIKDAWGIKLYLKNKMRAKKETDVEKKNNAARIKKLYYFRDTFLTRGFKILRSTSEIKVENFAAFITGSDIVWAPKKVNTFGENGYFLSFVNDGIKRVAYAPSIDCKPCFKLNRLKKYYKENLRKIDCISVREKTNIPFIQSLTDKKVYECCDPVFLMNANYYDEMISYADIKYDNKPYIYVYILEVNQDIVDFANKLAKKKGLKICYFSQHHTDYDVESESCNADSPLDFLFRLKNAEYVLTNSFHCVVFSLLFKKQFLSFARSNISIKSSDLLEKFDLTERLVKNNNAVDIDKPIDFDKVGRTIEKIKNESMKYLKDSLSEFI